MHQSLLQLVLSVFVDELLVVGDDRLGNSLTHGVDLRRMPTAGYPHADVDASELVRAKNQDGLVDLYNKGWRKRGSCCGTKASE